MADPGIRTAEAAGSAHAATSRAKGVKKKQSKDPVADLAGILKDDPTWDEFVEAMRRARAEEAAQEDVPR
jgi:hypothetical protein